MALNPTNEIEADVTDDSLDNTIRKLNELIDETDVNIWEDENEVLFTRNSSVDNRLDLAASTNGSSGNWTTAYGETQTTDNLDLEDAGYTRATETQSVINGKSVGKQRGKLLMGEVDDYRDETGKEDEYDYYYDYEWDKPGYRNSGPRKYKG